MTSFLVPRDGKRDLAFDGERLGTGSSKKRPDSGRWFELDVYRTVSGKLVAAGRGMSAIEGEKPRHWAFVAETPEELVARLTRVDDRGVAYLPSTTHRVLEDVADRVPGLRDALTEKV